MLPPKSVQAGVSEELAARARTAAFANGLELSEWLRSPIVRASENDLSVPSDQTVLLLVYRQMLFAMVGVEDLLGG